MFSLAKFFLLIVSTLSLLLSSDLLFFIDAQQQQQQHQNGSLLLKTPTYAPQFNTALEIVSQSIAISSLLLNANPFISSFGQQRLQDMILLSFCGKYPSSLSSNNNNNNNSSSTTNTFYEKFGSYSNFDLLSHPLQVKFEEKYFQYDYFINNYNQQQNTSSSTTTAIKSSPLASARGAALFNSVMLVSLSTFVSFILSKFVDWRMTKYQESVEAAEYNHLKKELITEKKKWASNSNNRQEEFDEELQQILGEPKDYFSFLIEDEDDIFDDAMLFVPEKFGGKNEKLIDGDDWLLPNKDDEGNNKRGGTKGSLARRRLKRRPISSLDQQQEQHKKFDSKYYETRTAHFYSNLTLSQQFFRSFAATFLTLSFFFVGGSARAAGTLLLLGGSDVETDSSSTNNNVTTSSTSTSTSTTQKNNLDLELAALTALVNIFIPFFWMLTILVDRGFPAVLLSNFNSSLSSSSRTTKKNTVKEEDHDDTDISVFRRLYKYLVEKKTMRWIDRDHLREEMLVVVDSLRSDNYDGKPKQTKRKKKEVEVSLLRDQQEQDEMIEDALKRNKALSLSSDGDDPPQNTSQQQRLPFFKDRIDDKEISFRLVDSFISLESFSSFLKSKHQRQQALINMSSSSPSSSTANNLSSSNLLFKYFNNRNRTSTSTSSSSSTSLQQLMAERQGDEYPRLDQLASTMFGLSSPPRTMNGSSSTSSFNRILSQIVQFRLFARFHNPFLTANGPLFEESSSRFYFLFHFVISAYFGMCSAVSSSSSSSYVTANTKNNTTTKQQLDHDDSSSTTDAKCVPWMSGLLIICIAQVIVLCWFRPMLSRGYKFFFMSSSVLQLGMACVVFAIYFSSMNNNENNNNNTPVMMESLQNLLGVNFLTGEQVQNPFSSPSSSSVWPLLLYFVFPLLQLLISLPIFLFVDFFAFCHLIWSLLQIRSHTKRRIEQRRERVAQEIYDMKNHSQLLDVMNTKLLGSVEQARESRRKRGTSTVSRAGQSEGLNEVEAEMVNALVAKEEEEELAKSKNNIISNNEIQHHRSSSSAPAPVVVDMAHLLEDDTKNTKRQEASILPSPQQLQKEIDILHMKEFLSLDDDEQKQKQNKKRKNNFFSQRSDDEPENEFSIPISAAARNEYEKAKKESKIEDEKMLTLLLKEKNRKQRERRELLRMRKIGILTSATSEELEAIANDRKMKREEKEERHRRRMSLLSQNQEVKRDRDDDDQELLSGNQKTRRRRKRKRLLTPNDFIFIYDQGYVRKDRIRKKELVCEELQSKLRRINENIISNSSGAPSSSSLSSPAERILQLQHEAEQTRRELERINQLGYNDSEFYSESSGSDDDNTTTIDQEDEDDDEEEEEEEVIDDVEFQRLLQEKKEQEDFARDMLRRRHLGKTMKGPSDEQPVDIDSLVQEFSRIDPDDETFHKEYMRSRRRHRQMLQGGLLDENDDDENENDESQDYGVSSSTGTASSSLSPFIKYRERDLVEEEREKMYRGVGPTLRGNAGMLKELEQLMRVRRSLHGYDLKKKPF